MATTTIPTDCRAARIRARRLLVTGHVGGLFFFRIVDELPLLILGAFGVDLDAGAFVFAGHADNARAHCRAGSGRARHALARRGEQVLYRRKRRGILPRKRRRRAAWTRPARLRIDGRIATHRRHAHRGPGHRAATRRRTRETGNAWYSNRVSGLRGHAARASGVRKARLPGNHSGRRWRAGLLLLLVRGGLWIPRLARVALGRVVRLRGVACR